MMEEKDDLSSKHFYTCFGILRKEQKIWERALEIGFSKISEMRSLQFSLHFVLYTKQNGSKGKFFTATLFFKCVYGGYVKLDLPCLLFYMSLLF